MWYNVFVGGKESDKSNRLQLTNRLFGRKECMILSGHDVSGMTYFEIQEVFEKDERALCEDVSPHDCDCGKCPTQEICQWLCENI